MTGVLAILILGLGLTDLWIPTLVPGAPFWVIFVVGYAVVPPLVAIVLGEDEDDRRTDWDGSDDRERAEEEEEEPLERLKRRYGRVRSPTRSSNAGSSGSSKPRDDRGRVPPARASGS